MEPEYESNVENTASLPIIKNSVVLPYQNSEELAIFVKSLPQTLCKIIYNGIDKVLCLVCKKLIVLHQMWNNVGFHILHKLWNTSDQVLQPVGEIPLFLWFGWLCQVANKFHKKETWSGHYCVNLFISSSDVSGLAQAQSPGLGLALVGLGF